MERFIVRRIAPLREPSETPFGVHHLVRIETATDRRRDLTAGAEVVAPQALEYFLKLLRATSSCLFAEIHCHSVLCKGHFLQLVAGFGRPSRVWPRVVSPRR